MIYTKYSSSDHPSSTHHAPSCTYVNSRTHTDSTDRPCAPADKALKEKVAEKKTDTAHRPTLCFSERNDTSRGSASSPPLLFPRPLTLCGIFILCMLSFICGCCMTERSLCRVMLAIGCASSGHLPVWSDETLSEPVENEPVYRKYESENALPSDSAPSTDGTLSYLRESTTSDTIDHAENASQAVAVDASEGGSIGTDTETLLPVVARDLRARADDLFSLSNETSYTPDIAALLEKTPAALSGLTLSDEPLVLILHTHGTEGYNECTTQGYYNPSASTRNEDIQKNVVSIGSAMAAVFNDFGIATIHDTEMCDKASFVRAYKTSAERVDAYLAAYPSIRFVIDLHRDAIIAADGTSTAPLFSYADTDIAQLMLVVGTDHAGAAHPHWEENLSLALHIQKELSAEHPGLLRRINLRAASFNQQRSTGYLLLECGAVGNSREQAERAARLFAMGLSRMITNAAT